MAGENRKRIQRDPVHLPLPPFEFDIVLFGRSVFRAKEARPGGDGSRIGGCIGRDGPAGVVLEDDVHASDFQGLYGYLLQVPVVLSGQRPDRKLVLDEFVDFPAHYNNASKVSLSDSNSCSKFGVNTPLPMDPEISSMVQ